MVLPNGDVQIFQTIAQDVEQIDSAFEKLQSLRMRNHKKISFHLIILL